MANHTIGTQVPSQRTRHQCSEEGSSPRDRIVLYIYGALLYATNNEDMHGLVHTKQVEDGVDGVKHPA